MTKLRPLTLALVGSVTIPSALATTVLVDFGGTNATGNWNSISDAATGSVADAIDDTGLATGIGIAVGERFGGTNTSGLQTSAVYPGFATGDSFYANADSNFGGLGPYGNDPDDTLPFPTVLITGLDPLVAYDFTFYASRNAADNRETIYTLDGANSGMAALNAAGNVDGVATISGIVPTGGMVTLEVSEGANNNEPNGFIYLGVMQIDFTPVPEPSAAVLLFGAAGFGFFRRRR